MKASSLFRDIPQSLPQESVNILAQSSNVKIERIVSRGHISPHNGWYEQSQDEFVLLVEGQAEITFESSVTRLEKGDYLTIPAGVKHKVSFTSTIPDAIWLTVFFDSNA